MCGEGSGLWAHADCVVVQQVWVSMAEGGRRPAVPHSLAWARHRLRVAVADPLLNGRSPLSISACVLQLGAAHAPRRLGSSSLPTAAPATVHARHIPRRRTDQSRVHSVSAKANPEGHHTRAFGVDLSTAVATLISVGSSELTSSMCCSGSSVLCAGAGAGCGWLRLAAAGCGWLWLAAAGRQRAAGRVHAHLLACGTTWVGHTVTDAVRVTGGRRSSEDLLLVSLSILGTHRAA